jgi:hypothetical protein
MTNKVFDAVVLIDIIAECHFPALLRAWSMNPRYELWIPAEINREVLNGSFFFLVKNVVYKDL